MLFFPHNSGNPEHSHMGGGDQQSEAGSSKSRTCILNKDCLGGSKHGQFPPTLLLWIILYRFLDIQNVEKFRGVKHARHCMYCMFTYYVAKSVYTSPTNLLDILLYNQWH